MSNGLIKTTPSNSAVKTQLAFDTKGMKIAQHQNMFKDPCLH